MEGRGGIKLSKYATMEEREQEKLVETMGKKAPFIWSHKMWPLGLKKLPALTARPGAGLAGQEPEAAGLGPA